MMKNASLLRKIGVTLTVAGVLSTSLGSVAAVAVGLASTAPTAVSAATSSGMNKKWLDEAIGDRTATNPSYAAFENLKVSVSQTQNITNQGVTVNWEGASPTSMGSFATNFLQVMQCWGDEKTGPKPQQCQWGAPASGLSGLLGDRTSGRNLKKNEDPNQPYTSEYLMPPPLTNPNQKAYTVPFTTVDGETVTDPQEHFTSSTTNEVSAARTGADGTGTLVFTTQTSLEAPHLGCGAVTPKGPRACWLVVVPRGDVAADGSPATSTADGFLTGSPLSETNWDNRLVFPLKFQQIGSACKIGNSERRIVGHELFTDAMTSWQSSLCASGTTFGFSQIGDDEARVQIGSQLQGASRLGVVSSPGKGTPATPVAYAPVARGAIVVGFNIERDYTLGSPLASRDGTAVEELTLNARLITKLLTQSYRSDVPGGGGKALAANPRTIVGDPEFVALNPEFAQFAPSAGPEGLLVALGSSDAFAQVWEWLKADPHSAAFLRGKPDQWGMVINPAYLALKITGDDSISSFPKADLSMYRQDDSVPAPGYGTLDLRPYMSDMREAAYRAQRAESGSKVVWNPFKIPAGFTSSGAQLPGNRFELALTTLVSADRYGLRTASIVNQVGDPVAATNESISVATSAMKTSATAPGARIFDPSARTLGAYPLSTVSHAAVAVCLASPAEQTDYAKLLEYVAGAGQKVGDSRGQLPRGYVPLTPGELGEVKALTKGLRQGKVAGITCPSPVKPTPKPTVKPTAKPQPTTQPTPSVNPPATTPPGTPETPTDPTTDPSVTPTPGTGDVAPDESVTVDAQVTQAPEMGWQRMSVAGSLGFGLPSAIAGPLLVRRSKLLAKTN